MPFFDASTQQLPRAVFLSHGGGPLPLLGEPGHQDMVTALKELAGYFPKPEAIIVFSAHWEAEQPVITGGSTPELIYDYYGFPPESYEIQYPCSGHPELASTVHSALQKAGFESQIDEQRGYDHGVFVPLKIMYPEADIPCIQVSLLDSLNVEQHLKMGEALASLSLHERGVLVVGSGFSFHNLRAFFSAPDEKQQRQGQAFDDWLADVCLNSQMDEATRREKLLSWSLAEGARYAHPREEHLLPLHVCYGLAQQAASAEARFAIMNQPASIYVWS